jgi:hypothetical protein
MNQESTTRSFTTNYKTYIFEFWVIWFSYGETAERRLTAEEIGALWNEAKFGNVGRVIATLVGYPFSIGSYILMKQAQSRAKRGLST